MKSLYTIGYEGKSIDEFIAILRGFTIERVIDIRRNPISRKPGFSKSTLSRLLTESNIAYSHVVELGTPDGLRKVLKSNDDYNEFFEGVEEYISNQQDALRAVLDMALSQRCVLLCFERNVNECHRMVVASYIARIGNLEITIEHVEL